MALPLALIFPVLSLIIIYLYRRTRSPKSSLPLPPGPKGLPLIGNIYDLPPAGAMPWQHWLTHKDAYGPLSSITVLGQVYVLINDAAVALELLRDQAAATAGRPHQVFNNDMIGWKEGLGFLQPGESFRLQRKNIAKVASAKSMIAAFDLVQEEESIHFLNNLAERPEDFLDHIRTEAGTVILRTTFGYTPRSDGRDPLVDMVAVTMANFGEAAVPGRWMVDTIPWLRYLPDWMPGTEFKRIGRRMEAQLSRTVNVPYEFVAKQLREGRSKPSYLSRAMQEDEPTPKNATVHKWAATSLYNGGSDTTVSSLMTFFLAISLFPEAQRKAQEELDRVIGGNRLPISKDKERLPYIEAIVKETHRWHPVAPMAVPHTALEETVCRGYCIPKGAMLLPNTWWITHDPAMYPDPFTFNPDRFITTPTHTAEPDPRTYTFGYGKRMCPGKYVADNALFITIAQTLSMFNISKGVENGKVIEPKLEFDPGVVSHPLPFKTTITPRSERHREVIRRAQEMHPYGESDAKELENLDTTFAV